MDKDDNLLQQARYPQQHLDIKLTLWRPSTELHVKTTTLFSSIHIYLNKLLVITVVNHQLIITQVNCSTLHVEEQYPLQETEKDIFIDYMFLHPQTYLVHDSVFFVCNYNRNYAKQIFYADLNKRQLLHITGTAKPQVQRTHYSMTLFKDFELIMFGGFDDQMKMCNIVDSYNIVMCDFVAINTKGQPPCPRHSHMAHATQSNLIIAGGSTSSNLFNRNYLNDMFLLDMQNHQWSQCKQQIPKNIGFGQSVQLSQSQILYFGEEKGHWQHYMLNLKDYSWQSLRVQKDVPEYRYQTSMCLDLSDNQVFVYGGFNFSSSHLFNFQMDRLQIVLQTTTQKQFYTYGGQQIQLDKFERQVIVQDENDENDIQEELTFEELLEQEKRLQQLDQLKEEELRNKKKNNKKKSRKNKS